MWIFTYIYTAFILLDQRYDFKPYFSKHLTIAMAIVQFWISPIGLTETNKIDTIGIRTVYGTESRSNVFEIIF